MIGFRSIGIIALGGNLPSCVGAPQVTLGHAIAAMPASGLMIRAVSRFFATPCFPAGAGPDYVNAAVCVGFDMSPAELLTTLHKLEHDFGRERRERWGMRTLDLDVLAIGQFVLPDPDTQRHWQTLPAGAQAGAVPDQLVLPHPRLQDRAFALVPMTDIAPGWVHPVLGETAAGLCAALPRSEIDAIRPL